MSAVTPSFSTLSLISSILVLIPYPWYLQSRNIGTCLYMVFTSLGCLNLFINSLTWRGGTNDTAPVWCDILTKFMIAVGAALPTASLCISRRLYWDLVCAGTPYSCFNERRRQLVDFAIGLSVPIVCAVLHIIVQQHRFDIFQDYGCTPSIYNTPLAYVIVQGPILVVAVASLIHCYLSITVFRRSTVDNSPRRFRAPSDFHLRLLCLATTEAVLSIFGALVSIVVMSRGQAHPWISWQDTHSGFAVIEEFPVEVWRDDPGQRLVLEESRWALVARGLAFFALFGSTKELKTYYWLVFAAVVDRLRSNTSGSQRDHRDVIPPLDLGDRFNLDATTSMSSSATSSRSTVLHKTPFQLEKNNVIRSPSPASTAEIPSSVAVSQGHGLPHQEGSLPPSPTGSAWSGANAEHGHELGNTSVLFSLWKDLPLPPQRNSDSVPSSATTSESMYSTNTDCETEFTFNIDVPAPLHFKDSRPFTITGTIQSKDPGYLIAGAPPTRSRSWAKSLNYS